MINKEDLLNKKVIFEIDNQQLTFPLHDILTNQGVDIDEICTSADEKELIWDLEDISYEFLTDNLSINIK